MPQTKERKLTSILKSFDQHGYPISLTYKSHETFRTAVGGLLTIISRLGIIAYFLVLLFNVINKQKEVIFKSIYIPSNTPTQQYVLDSTNFDIAFSMFSSQTNNLERLNLEKYISFNFTKIDYGWQYLESGVRQPVRNFTDMGTTNCTLDRFGNQSDKIKVLGMNAAGWYCIGNRNMTLKGQPSTIERTTLRLLINPCKNTSTSQVCGPQEEIDKYLSNAVVYVSTLNSYFDQDEFGRSPVKLDIQTIVYNLNPKQGLYQLVNLKQNTLRTLDHWLSNYFDNNAYTFYQPNLDQLLIGNLQDNLYGMITLGLFCDSEEIMISRQVTTLIDTFSTLGGFTSFILLISRFLIKSYSKASFQEDVMKGLYKIDDSPAGSFTEIYSPKFKKDLVKLQPTQTQYFNKILNMINNKSMLRMNKASRIIKNTMFLFCRNACSKRLNSLTFEDKILSQNFDLEKIQKIMRKFKIMMRILLTEQQKKIISEFENILPCNLDPFKGKAYYSRIELNNDVQQLVVSKSPLDKRMIEYLIRNYDKNRVPIIKIKEVSDPPVKDNQQNLDTSYEQPPPPKKLNFSDSSFKEDNLMADAFKRRKSTRRVFQLKAQLDKQKTKTSSPRVSVKAKKISRNTSQAQLFQQQQQ